MEEKQQSHILSNLTELVRDTTCHSLFIAFLESRELLSESDISDINSIDNRLNKSEAFYRIITKRSNSYDTLCEALKETGQSGALDILERIKPIRFDVRQPVHLFTGREDELTKLHSHLRHDKDIATLVTHTASVTGLGGIGKTELCRKYIQKYSEEYDNNVIWIGAERAEQMENSFRILAKDYLKISLEDEDGGIKEIQTVVDEVYNCFRDKKCLFIFDNAVSSHDEQLNTFLPVRVAQRPHLLITSRDRDWELPMNVLELEELKETEAIEFVKKGLLIQDQTRDEILLVLVRRLQRFPLAIQQAISFISERGAKQQFEVEDYIKSFDTESMLVLSHQISPFLSNKYTKTTFTTWKITTDFIATDEECGSKAIQILNMISYFEPDDIPSTLLLQHPEWNEDEMHFALQLLVKYSMVSCQLLESMLNIHRLVQEVTRIHLKKNNQEEQTLEAALHLTSASITSEDEDTIYHAVSAYKFSSVLCPELSAEFKHLPWRIVNVLTENMRYKEGKTVGEELEAILSKFLPEGNSDLIRLKFMLAEDAYFLQENLEMSLEAVQVLLQKYVENRENSFSETETQSVERLLADHLRYLKRYPEAFQVSRSTFERQKSLYGLNHWQTITTLVDIAYAIWKLQTDPSSSDLDEDERKILLQSNEDELSSAICVFKEAHQINLELVGKDLNWTQAMFTVANCLDDIGRTEYGPKIITDVIERTEDLSDKGFSSIWIRCTELLARIKKSEGKPEEALVICKTVHSKLVLSKGENDPATAQANWKVFMTLLEMGQLEAAIESYTTFRKSCEKETKLSDQEQAVKVLVGIINILCRMDRSEKILELLEKMKTKMETQFGSHPLLETVNKQIELFGRGDQIWELVNI